VLDTTLYYGPSTSTANSYVSSSYNHIAFTNQASCDGYFGPGGTTFVAPHGCCFIGGSGSGTIGAAQTASLSAFVAPFHLE
jgi:hypothetical protein